MDKIHLMDSEGAFGGLYMFPIVNCLFSLKIIFTKRHSKYIGFSLGTVSSEDKSTCKPLLGLIMHEILIKKPHNHISASTNHVVGI